MPQHEPVMPHIVDPTGVNLSIEPRPLGESTDASRSTIAEQTGGVPMTDFDGTTNPYIDYQFIDLLLSLQAPRSNGYDEHCFIIMGQVKELLFKGLHFELFNARALLDDDQVDEAIVVLERATAFADYITASWDVLSTITTEGFSQFRDQLSTASGQLSFMYRHVEFILGNKNQRLASAHDNLPHVWPALRQALEAPSLYDAAIATIDRAGYHVGGNALSRNWAEPYEPDPAVQAAWLGVYQNPSPVNVHYRLAETLVTFDEHFSIYRWRHFRSVEKIIGYKPGTGGSAGVDWLRHVTDHRFFPELWSVRNDL